MAYNRILNIYYIPTHQLKHHIKNTSSALDKQKERQRIKKKSEAIQREKNRLASVVMKANLMTSVDHGNLIT